MALPKKKKYRLLLNSDEDRFGGFGNEAQAELVAEKEPFHYHKFSATVDLPPYGALVYLY